MSLLDRVLVPVANEDDARGTARSLAADLPETGAVVLVGVVEKAGGAPDKVSPDHAEQEIADAFDAFEAVIGASLSVPVERRVEYHTDVVEGIFEAAGATGATAIAFVPREGSRLTRLLTGDRSLALVTRADRPVVALPRVEADDAATGRADDAADGEADGAATGDVDDD